MKLSSFKIQHKLYALTTSILVAVLFLSFFFKSSIKSFDDSARKNREYSKVKRQLSVLIFKLTDNQVGVFNTLLEASEGEIDEEQIYEKSITNIEVTKILRGELKEVLLSYSSLVKRNKKITKILKIYDLYVDDVLSAITMSTVDIKLAEEKIVVSNKAFSLLNKEFNKMFEFILLQDNEHTELSLAHSEKENNKINLVLVFLSITLISLSFILSRNITNSISKILELTRSVSRNSNYTVRGSISNEDELGELMKDFNFMLEQIEMRDLKQKVLQLEFKDLAYYNRNILESLNEFLLVTDDAGRVEFINQKALIMIGMTEDEVVGKLTISNHFLSLDDVEDISFDILRDRIQSSEMSELKGKIINTKEGHIPVLISGSLYLGAEGSHKGIILTAVDASESVLLQEIQDNQNKMIEIGKMASLGAVTAGIAHEIKNPLNLIINSATILKDTVQDEFSPTEESSSEEEVESFELLIEMADIVIDNSSRATNIVNSMLLQARSGSGELEEVSLSDLLKEQLDFAYHSMRAKYPFQIEPILDLEPIGDITIFKQEMSRALINILDNALYSIKEKLIRIREKNNFDFIPTLKVSVKEVNECIEIKVYDNGMGIDQVSINKITEPFFTTKPAGVGTGLGMSMVNKIISELHNGELKINSTKDEFCEITLTFPYDARRAA